MDDDNSLDLNEVSIAHWFNDLEVHKCGYCKNPEGSVSYGMWAEVLSACAYQNLIDRGWRRSGLYCYKPMMDQTCCPQYTIRCNALELALTKSQKKVIKRMNKFLANGEMNKVNEKGDDQEGGDGDLEGQFQRECSESMLGRDKIESQLSCSTVDIENCSVEEVGVPSTSSSASNNIDIPRNTVKQKIAQSGSGADPGKPKCKKAKLLRLERKQKKLEAQGKEFKPQKVDNTNNVKTLEDFLNDIPQDSKHMFKLRLVPTSEPGDEWERCEETEFQLYKKYQQIVHNDKNCSLDGFRRFLVNSPIKPTVFGGSTDLLGYGSFHQQYWIDDKLIAVGVIDILPKCVSSVYFFYDPDYRFLTLGTYGSFRELQLTRFLHSKVPSIQYYYMGFYIHSCPKMRYKGKLVPSMLLCPESYSWIPIEKCLPKLDVSKYSRLNDDVNAEDPDQCTKHDIDHIKIIINYVCMYYKVCKRKFPDVDAVHNIAKYVGKKAVSEILFVISK